MSKPPRDIRPRYPLIKKGDELVFDTSKMVTQELEYKYITNKKVQFAVFPAVNVDNEIGTVGSATHPGSKDWVECVVYYPLDVYQEMIKTKKLVPNEGGNVSVKMGEAWFIVSNGIRGKGHRLGAVYPTASDHMYQGRFFYGKKTDFDAAAAQSPAWAKFLKIELSECRLADQKPHDGNDSWYAE